MGDGAQAFQLSTPGFSNGDFLPVICYHWWQRRKATKVDTSFLLGAKHRAGCQH